MPRGRHTGSLNGKWNCKSVKKRDWQEEGNDAEHTGNGVTPTAKPPTRGKSLMVSTNHQSPGEKKWVYAHGHGVQSGEYEFQRRRHSPHGYKDWCPRLPDEPTAAPQIKGKCEPSPCASYSAPG